MGPQCRARPAHHQRRHDVFQLPHIAWPVVSRKGVQRRSCRCGAASGQRLRAAPKVLRQQHDIVASLPQRGHHHPEHVEAVQEVLAESASDDRVIQRAIGGRHDPHIHASRLIFADPPDFPILQDPQQFGLCPLG